MENDRIARKNRRVRRKKNEFPFRKNGESQGERNPSEGGARKDMGRQGVITNRITSPGEISA
jgi:hypothetical protein